MLFLVIVSSQCEQKCWWQISRWQHAPLMLVVYQSIRIMLNTDLDQFITFYYIINTVFCTFAFWITAQRGREEDREGGKETEKVDLGEKVDRLSKRHSYNIKAAYVLPTFIAVDSTVISHN